MYTPTDELVLHSQRAFDVCRDQVYNYEDCRQLDYHGEVNPSFCSKETLDLMKCYEKVEEMEPICMHAFSKYKECNYVYGGNLVQCEKEMNEFNLCQEKPRWYADNIFPTSSKDFPAYSTVWKRPPY
jgi:hypothetical protein